MEELLNCPWCDRKPIERTDSYIPGAVSCAWGHTAPMTKAEWNTRTNSHPQTAKVSVEEVLKVLEDLAHKQMAATIKAVDKKGLMNTGWDDIDKEGGHLDFEVIAKAIYAKFSNTPLSGVKIPEYMNIQMGHRETIEYVRGHNEAIDEFKRLNNVKDSI